MDDLAFMAVIPTLVRDVPEAKDAYDASKSNWRGSICSGRVPRAHARISR
jgi:hypothetical protein